MNNTFTKKRRNVLILASMALALLFTVGFAGNLRAQSTNPSPYCGAAGLNGTICDGWTAAFEKVEFNKLKFDGPSCPSISRGLYSYWNASSFPKYTTDVTPGSSYLFKTQNGPATTTGNRYAGWIDWNGDRDFNDAGEYFATNRNINFNTTDNYSQTVSVPCSAKPGLTRMRLRVSGSNTFNSTTTCNSVTWGETFDFDITINTPSNPTANFFIPDTVFTGSPATFINANKDGYIGHQWSTSVNGLSTIEATTTNFLYAFPSAGTYQVRITSTNCAGSATTTKNVVVVDPTVAPSVRFLASRNYIPLAANDPVVDEIVDFLDFSTSGPTTYLWEITPPDFDKFWFYISGSQSTRNMSIFFTDTANYQVCLTASNSIGSTKLCKDDYVVIEYPTNSNKIENVICEDLRSGRDSGVVYDPGGKDKNYPDKNALCQFVIDVCDAENIEIFVPNAEYGLGTSDFLRIYDGPDVTGKLLFQGGNNQALGGDKNFVAESGKATVEFQSNTFTSGKGFALYWKTNYRNDGPINAAIDVVDRLSNDSIYNCLATREIRFSNATKNTREIEDIQWIFDYDANIAYPAGFEDFPYNNDEENPTYVYTNDKTYSVRLVVKSCEGWDTAYRTFHLATTSMLPIVDFSTDESIISVGENTTLRNKTVAWCEGTWTISPGDFTLLNGGTLTDQDINVQFDKAGRYTVKYTATNDNGSASRTRTDYVRVIDYCTPTVGTPLQSMSISRVKFAGQEVVSSLGNNGYENNSTPTSPEVYIGGSYDIEVERDQNVDLADRKVWIDFNRDGTFDASEVVASDFNSTSKVLATTVTIPDNSVVTPGIARMRVGIAFAGKPFTACGPIDVGEYEDYLIVMKADDVPPVITMNGADSVYIEVNTSYNDAGATAFDNREGNITGRIVTVNQVDSSQTGVYVVTYNVKDGSGIAAQPRVRFVFVLTDLTAPTLTVVGNATQTHEVNTPYSDSGATAIDNPSAVNIDNLIIADNQVDETQLGTYEVNYTVTDAYGNTSTAKRIVNVVDRTSPVINAVGGNPMTVQVNSNFADPTTVSDNYWTNVQLNVVSGQVNTSVFGQYKVTYSAVDGSGNAATQLTRVYNVTDLVPPVLTSRSGSEFMTVAVNDLSFTEPAVTGSDNYFPTVNITRTGNFDITELGDYTITYTGTDGAGNTSVYTRIIRVVDNSSPIVISTPANLERWTVFNPFDGVSTWDNYWAPNTFENIGSDPTKFKGKVEILSSNVNMLKEGLYQVIYQAVDGSGNISVPHLRLVNVTSNTTGIQDVTFGEAINIYPNPNSGKFEVEFGVPVHGDATITIMNIAGQAVRTFSANDVLNNKLTVDLSEVAAGVYFVQIQSNGQVANKKVTVTR